MFTTDQITKMNQDLKNYMLEHTALIGLFGYDSALSFAAYEVYKQHGGV